MSASWKSSRQQRNDDTPFWCLAAPSPSSPLSLLHTLIKLLKFRTPNSILLLFALVMGHIPQLYYHYMVKTKIENINCCYFDDMTSKLCYRNHEKWHEFMQRRQLVSKTWPLITRYLLDFFPLVGTFLLKVVDFLAFKVIYYWIFHDIFCECVKACRHAISRPARQEMSQ